MYLTAIVFSANTATINIDNLTQNATIQVNTVVTKTVGIIQ